MSNTYPTSDIPLGSTSPKVLYNNASNFDEFSVSPNPTFTDRYNKLRKTIAGMEMDFQDFLVQSGYRYIGADYVDGVPGLTFTSRNQYTVRAGIAYRLAVTAPIPYVTTGVWATDQPNFLAFELDSILLADLANNFDPLKGAGMIGYAGRTVYARLQDVVNVLDYGADPTGATDSLAAFNAARDKLMTSGDFRGGKIVIPNGYYKLSGEWTFTAGASIVHNITIVGNGILCVTLDFTSAPSGTDGIRFTGAGAHVVVNGFMIRAAKRHGLVFETCHEISVQEIRVQNCIGDGIHFNDTFMCSLSDIWSTTNGGNGITFAQKHTSVTGYRVYTNDNVGIGLSINGMTYSAFIACGSDNNNKGYSVSNVRGLVFLGCGAEANKTDAWYVFSSNASQGTLPVEFRYINGLELIGCAGYFNSAGNPGLFGGFITVIANDANPIQFSMKGCGSARANVADFSVILSGATGPITYTDDGARHDAQYSITGNVMPTDYYETIVPSGSSLSLTTSVTRSIASITLPAGDWEVSGKVLFTPNGSTAVAGYYAGIGITPNALPTEHDYSTGGVGYTRTPIAATFDLLPPVTRIRSQGSTVVFLQAQAAFSSGPLVAAGKIMARKL